MTDLIINALFVNLNRFFCQYVTLTREVDLPDCTGYTNYLQLRCNR